ncbi:MULTISPECIES: DUF6802 family protein [Pseudonocardia]|uniref:DUF6802 domain-containing protein n=2 Tax=Pseudonocardia TaxID=1847 RepID=A0A1Y2MMK8_PSEAH|nr:MULTISPECIES: DUF6802 family protein [Pseudonocardia]OSY36483.1 hypothetical protein BG845_05405 [Pseudonocardia autotrophica]TDN74775.1 hypothetical protein C8E95_3905 [Pseudonocardia autotrophica]BBG05550.1 hypothetical protein Pdca_67590 [Pseudonocardia autotrophica]GEC29033.1 hypothetical protein PSA01_60620 [Pseudonocardia saturnea]
MQVPRAPVRGPDPGAGAAVPVIGPAARDTDHDGLPDTLVVEGPAGTSFWIDTDRDGLADHVVGPVPADPAPVPADPSAGLLDAVAGIPAGR